MRTYVFQAIVLLGVSIFIAAASAGDDKKTEQAEPDAEVQSFSEGAKAWADNCARCHNFREPAEYTDEQWDVVMNHMQLRASLDGKDVRNIKKFLQQSN